MKIEYKIFVISVCLSGFYAHAELPENYSRLSAQEKQEILWENVNQNPYEKLATQSISFWEKISHFLGTENNLQSDERPQGVKPLIHRYGSVAKVRFTSSNRTSPYTDIFRTGAPGIIRLSLAFPRSNPETDAYLPGLALKLLVDGNSPSLNFFAIESQDGQLIEGTQEPDRNFFANDLSTLFTHPRSYFARTMSLFFGKNSVETQVLEQTRVPKEIIFKPTLDVTFLIDPTSHGDFRSELAQVFPGKTLYEVFGREDGINETRLGNIVLESPLTASAYGDNQLSF